MMAPGRFCLSYIRYFLEDINHFRQANLAVTVHIDLLGNLKETAISSAEIILPKLLMAPSLSTSSPFVKGVDGRMLLQFEINCQNGFR